MKFQNHSQDSFLLPIEPMGLGTEHIESSASFFSRVAILHQSSTWQLARLLSDASEIIGFGKKQPKCSGQHTLVSNGYGKLAEAVTAWLEFGLNRDDLSALTFLALRDVLPAAGGGILRNRRAWCSECVLEWRSNDQPVYEKLIWSLASSARCHVHLIALEQRCHFCGEYQSWYPAKAFNTANDILFCTHCQKDLVPREYQPFTDGIQPDKYERHILSVIKATAENPSMRYGDEQIIEFLQAIEDMSSGEQSNLMVLSRRFGSTNIARIARGEGKPALKTACSIADLVGATLAEVLDDPHQSAKKLILSAEFYQSARPDRRELRTRGKQSVLKTKIAAELERGRYEKPTALKAICQELNISSANAYSWFPEKSKELSKLNEFWLDEQSAEHRLQARNLAYSVGLPNYLRGEFPTQKALVLFLVEEFGVQKTAMRNAMKHAIDDWEIFKSDRFTFSPLPDGIREPKS